MGVNITPIHLPYMGFENPPDSPWGEDFEEVFRSSFSLKSFVSMGEHPQNSSHLPWKEGDP